jgi:hypothetical protein
MLAWRLARHGLALSADGLTVALSRQAAAASVPPLLVVSTVKAVTRVAAGEAAAAALSADIAALAEGVVKSMFLNKLKWVGVCVLMMMALFGTGMGGFAYRGRAAEQAPPTPPAKEAKPAKPAPSPRQAPAQVTQILRDALEAARTIEDKQWKAWMLESIAAEQAKGGDKKAAARIFKEALEAAKEIDGFAKYHTTHGIAGSMARAGNIEGARKVAEAIEHEDSRDYGLMQIAAAQARTGDIKGAIKTAETISTERHKSAALRVVVEVHTEAGRLKEAAKLAETIAEDSDRAFAFVAIATARAKAKDRAAARKDLAEALKIADGIPEEHDGGWVTYTFVAKAQAEMGDGEQALKTANAIKKEVWKNNALCFIVKARVKAGDLQAAREAAETIPSEYVQGEAMKEIVAARLRAGEVKEATKAAASIDSVAWRVQSMLEIAKFQAKAGDRSAADKTFQKAFKEAEDVRDEEPGVGNIHNSVLSHILKAQAEAGEEKKALDWAAKQTYPLLKTQTLLGIAQALAQRQEERKGPRE